jgi:hypothetical protein
MRKMTRYLIGAMLAAVVGVACLASSVLEGRMLRAGQDLVALDYNGSEQALEDVERYLEYGNRLPWISQAPLHDVVARRAALRYWRRDYSGLVPAVADPVASLPADNIELRFVVANAVYRSAQARAKDPKSWLQAIDAGLIAYMGVLKSAPRHENAAFNYEYLVRLRNVIGAGGRRPSGAGGDGEENSPHGQAGKPPPTNDMSKFKIHVPLESQELDQKKEGEKAGKTGAPLRKG